VHVCVAIVTDTKDLKQVIHLNSTLTYKGYDCDYCFCKPTDHDDMSNHNNMTPRTPGSTPFHYQQHRPVQGTPYPYPNNPYPTTPYPNPNLHNRYLAPTPLVLVPTSSCKFPGCNRPTTRDYNGNAYDYCSPAHGREHQNVKAHAFTPSPIQPHHSPPQLHSTYVSPRALPLSPRPYQYPTTPSTTCTKNLLISRYELEATRTAATDERNVRSADRLLRNHCYSNVWTCYYVNFGKCRIKILV
jgi:hypothetical protein